MWTSPEMDTSATKKQQHVFNTIALARASVHILQAAPLLFQGRLYFG